MFGLGFGEVILVLIIALVFIGPKKLPELAKNLGKAMRQFQDAAKGFQDQMTNEVNELKPKFDADDLPKLEEIKKDMTEIIPSANNSGHGDWDPYSDKSGESQKVTNLPSEKKEKSST